MPTVFNLSGKPLGAGISSVRVWFYTQSWADQFAIPASPTAMPVAEDATATTAHYVVYEGFARNNAAGASFGRDGIDTGDLTALQQAKALTVEDLLTWRSA
jgi:hypothetical protein